MRTRRYIYLSPKEVQGFVNAAKRCAFDVDVAADRANHYYVDGKSFLGVMGLDLSGRLVVCYSGYDETFERYLDAHRLAG